MIRHLLLSTTRSLTKRKLFLTLNITGLSIGMAVFLLIVQYANFTRSFEDFIPNANNIYRVSLTHYLNNEFVFSSAENYPGVGPAMKNDFPEVTEFARLYNLGYKNNTIITYEDAKPNPISFKHRRFMYADSAFLLLMGYPLVAGDPVTALSQPFTAVISEDYAHRYFGSDDPLGRQLRMQDDDRANELVKVTGVFKNLPANTHLKFDILFSYETLFTRGEGARDRYDHSWNRKDMYTFIGVRPETNIVTLEEKLIALVDKFKPDNKTRNEKDILALQPLKSIHLHSSLSEEPETNGDNQTVRFLEIIGLFILGIALINYVNLFTATALERTHEVGIRKTMGAFEHQLLWHFLIEAAIINILSALVSLMLVLLALPYVNYISGLSLDFNYLIQPWFLTLVVGLSLAGTILSGLYPAIVLSSFKPITVLNGGLRKSVKGVFLRKSLVVIQFMASVALISGTCIVYNQLSYMMNQDLGMNIDQVLVIERPGVVPRNRKVFRSAFDVFRDEVKKIRGVKALSASVTVPGKQREYKILAKKYGAPDDQQVTVRFHSMDFEFNDVFNMKMIAGRAFSEQYTYDLDTSVIITESTAKLLGFQKLEDAVGQTISFPDWWNAIIVGVVNDYHQVSLKKVIDPVVFYCSKYGGEFYSLRLETKNINATIEKVNEAWVKAFPGNPLDYFFLDDYFNNQYENEQKFGKLFATFSVLAVIVACIGLFGLSAYTANQRTKEIGIRKALGSTNGGIFVLLLQEYIKLVGSSILIATPLMLWIMNNWVQNFPYREPISPLVFAIAGISVLIIALLTISFQTMKASRAKPVESLRHE